MRPLSPACESELLRTLLEVTDDAIVVTDPAGLIMGFNGGAEKLLGYAETKVVEILNVVSWHDMNELRARARGMNTSPSVEESDFELLVSINNQDQLSGDTFWTLNRRDGSELSVLMKIALVDVPETAECGYLITYRDATKQRSTQERLRQEEQRFKDIVEYSAMGMATLTIDGHFILINEAYCKLLGYDKTELIGRSVWGLTHPEDLVSDQNKARKLLAGMLTHYHMEKRYIQKSGRTVWVILCVSLVRDHAGTPLYFVAQIQDITARKLATEELAATADLLREFIAHAPVAIAMLDKDLRYINVSDRWITDYDLAPKNVIGLAHYDLFPTIPQRWKDVHQRVLKGATESSREDALELEDGRTMWLNWEARPWHDTNGEIGGLIFFTRDITLQKESQQELERLVIELERSNRELEQFAYVASHDMQEPLRAVAGCAEILQSRYQNEIDDRADELITHIVEGANRMQTLIRDLLQLSRINTGPRELMDVETDLICQSIIQDLSTEIKASRASIILNDLPTVKGDATQLSQVFQNLISNALKYRSKAAPHIQISASREDDFWSFAVRDNGIGVEEAYFERIFDVFQRLHTRSEYPGTGIGLALCKKIVERHGGKIWITSTPGIGSVFHFTLPCLD